MKKKSIKKTLFILLFTVVVFFMNGKVVNAEDVSFPDYGDMSNYNGSYCSYTFGTFRKNPNPSADTTYYDSKTINLTYEDGMIKLVDPTSHLNGYMKDGGYVWHNATVKAGKVLLVDDDAAVVARMVNSNGELTCGSLSFSQGFGTLYITLDAKPDTDFTLTGTLHNPAGTKTCTGLENALAKIEKDFNNQITNSVSPVYNEAYNLYVKKSGSKAEFSGMIKRLESAEKALNSYTTALKKYDNQLPMCSDDIKAKFDELSSSINGWWDKLNTLKENLKQVLANLGYDELADEVETLLQQAREYARAASDLGSGNGREDCEGILGDRVLSDIKEILTYIRIAVPILIIVLGIVDFSKAVIGGDDKDLSKAVSNLIKRAIAAVAIFFAPIIIMMVINMIDSLAGGCDIRGW